MKECDFFLQAALRRKGLCGAVVESIKLGKMVVASDIGDHLRLFRREERATFIKWAITRRWLNALRVIFSQRTY